MRHAISLPHLSAVLSIVGGALLAGCLAVVPPVQAGALYRWVDAQGQVHLTDTPPPATREQAGLKVYHPRVVSRLPSPRRPPPPTPSDLPRQRRHPAGSSWRRC